MIDGLQFLAAAVVWALVGRAILETGLVHPVALFAVWLIGFVWIAGHMSAGTRAADHLVKTWLGTMAALTVIAFVATQFFS